MSKFKTPYLVKAALTSLSRFFGCVSACMASFSAKYLNYATMGAFFLAALIAMFSGMIAKGLVPDHHLAKDAVTIEGVEVTAGGAAAPSGPQPILGLLATADVEKGKGIAKACAACHTFDKGGPNGVGPNLYNTVNNKKDHAAGYAYSGALLKAGGPTWTYAELNHFLFKPKAYAPDTKMTFVGLKKPEDRAAVIAFLRTLADSPAALPGEAEIAAEQAELAPPAPAEGEAAHRSAGNRS
jgi:cytochrome c